VANLRPTVFSTCSPFPGDWQWLLNWPLLFVVFAVFTKLAFVDFLVFAVFTKLTFVDFLVFAVFTKLTFDVQFSAAIFHHDDHWVEVMIVSVIGCARNCSLFRLENCNLG